VTQFFVFLSLLGDRQLNLFCVGLTTRNRSSGRNLVDVLMELLGTNHYYPNRSRHNISRASWPL